VPDIIPFRTGRKGISYLIPEGTPWPHPSTFPPRPEPPPGYLLIDAWARKHKKGVATARLRLHQGRIPEAIRVPPANWYWAVPADLPWPARPYNPQPRGGAELHPGAGESSGGRPAPKVPHG
jgi:hypothetical protein